MEYLEISSHGGECCGIRHLHCFPDSGDFESDGESMTPENMRAVVQDGLDSILKSLPYAGATNAERVNNKDARIAVECVLNTGQRDNQGWGEVLNEMGFSEVFSFQNTNSGNRCHVYYKEINRPKRT